MKRIINILSLTFFFLSVNSQTNVYHPFPDSLACWNESGYYNGMNCPAIEIQHTYQMDGDTVIGAYTYHKVLNAGSEKCLSFNNSTPSYFSGISRRVYIRQNIPQKKVYAYFNNQDMVLYDFNLTTGQFYTTTSGTYSTSSGFYYSITSQDSILLNGNYRKRWWTSLQYGPTPAGYSPSGYVSIIEGVGSTSGLVYNGFHSGWSEMGWGLNSMVQNHQCLYVYGNNTCTCMFSVGIKEETANAAFNIHPNPVGNELKVESTGKIGTVVLYNGLGQVLYRSYVPDFSLTLDMSSFAPGIYILQSGAGFKKLVKQ